MKNKRRNRIWMLVFGAFAAMLGWWLYAHFSLPSQTRALIARAEAGDVQAQFELAQAYQRGDRTLRIHQDFGKAYAWAKAAAQAEHPEALLELGVGCLKVPKGSPEETREALDYFQRASRAGNIHADNMLGLMYLHGWMVPRDKARALEWYKTATEKSSADTSGAWLMLGRMYYEGWGTPKDGKMAVQCLRRVVEMKKSYEKEALAWLGWCYLTGTGVDADAQEAHRLWEQASEKDEIGNDDRGTVFYLKGLASMQGAGTPKDPAKAVEWFKKSFEAHNMDAALALGMCFLKGEGVAVDFAQARSWFERAYDSLNDEEVGRLMLACTGYARGVSPLSPQAEPSARAAAQAGDAEAALRLGLFLFPENPEAGRHWLEASAKGGNATAQYLYGFGQMKRIVIPFDDADALQWLRAAAENGDAPACCEYALYLLAGRGAKPDASEAVAWLRRAADKGYSDAMGMLGMCYLAGAHGVPQDPAEGAKLIRQAADAGHPDSQYMFGRLLLMDDSPVPKDEALGWEYIQKAADNGYTEAGLLLYVKKTGVPVTIQTKDY